MKKLVGFFVMSLLLPVIITGFLLGGVKVDRVQAANFVCPISDIAATGCKGEKDCLYPNPDSCYNFIQCTVNPDGITGTPVVQPCAPADPPLEWNDYKKECDFYADSTCGRIINNTLEEVEGNKVNQTVGGLLRINH